ncbi:MAG: TldD/PmbA family protein [Acholeplasmatales bacterium]|jgi:PmbA protein|nr:TldD/PmbA family protein [Acholeplasmatales bacterium]
MLKKIIEIGLKKGFNTIEVRGKKVVGLDIEVFGGQIEKVEKSDLNTINIKGLYRGHQASISIEDLDENKIEYYLDELITNASLVTSKEPTVFYKGAKKYHEVELKTSDLANHSIEEKQNLLLDLEALILKGKNASKVETTVYSESFTTFTLINSKGLNLSKTTGSAILYSVGIFDKDGDTQSSLDYKIGFNFADFKIDKLAKTIIKDGNAKLGASQIPTGTYDVVFSNEAFASLVSVFSSIFTSESLVRNITKLKDKVGTTIAASIVNLVDNPFSKHAIVQQAFDNEGYPTRKKNIIEKGVFKGFINNLKFAKMANQKPTGNGFNGISFVQAEVLPGKTSLPNLLKKVNNGVYVTELAGLHASVNPTSGSFQAQTSGFIIKDGKLGQAVRLVVLASNFFDILLNVQELASDGKLTMSDIYSPSVWVGRLPIAGK